MTATQARVKHREVKQLVREGQAKRRQQAREARMRDAAIKKEGRK
jgi:hypothetical protein